MRNNPCICGRDIKHKHCYGKQESENCCIQFLVDNKIKYIGLTQKHLDSVIAEVSPLIKSLEDNQNSIRSRFILVFSVLDTYSNFWRIFSGAKSISDTQLWREWIGLFIKNPLNPSYHKWIDLCGAKDIDGGDFYELRSSLSHFFAIGEKSRLVLITDFDEKIITKVGTTNSYAIDPGTLLIIVAEACKLMLDEINNRITSNSIVDLLNLKKLYFEIERNGGNRIELNSLR